MSEKEKRERKSKRKEGGKTEGNKDLGRKGENKASDSVLPTLKYFGHQ